VVSSPPLGRFSGPIPQVLYFYRHTCNYFILSYFILFSNTLPQYMYLCLYYNYYYPLRTRISLFDHKMINLRVKTQLSSNLLEATFFTCICLMKRLTSTLSKFFFRDKEREREQMNNVFFFYRLRLKKFKIN